MPIADYTNIDQDDPLGQGVAGYTPETVQLDESKDTVAGRINTLLREDSPILQQARTYAKQAANRTGTLNTSMTDGAIFGAMMDRATPIASQDAQTSFGTKTFNADSKNQGGQFNSNQYNSIASQLTGQNYQSGENALDRALQKTLQGNELTHRDEQAALDRLLQEKLQSNDQTWRTSESAEDRALQKYMQQSQQVHQEQLQQNDFQQQSTLQSTEQQWRSGEAAQERAQQLTIEEQRNLLQTILQEDMQDFEATQSQLQYEIQNRQLSMSQSNIILASQQDAINSVLMDGNLDATAKATAIRNIQSGAMQTVDFIDSVNKASYEDYAESRNETNSGENTTDSTSTYTGATGDTSGGGAPPPPPPPNVEAQANEYFASVVNDPNQTKQQKLTAVATYAKSANLPDTWLASAFTQLLGQTVTVSNVQYVLKNFA